MPSITQARAMNAALKLDNPVAVVVGGTSGIGASLAAKIAEYSSRPEIHLVGRSQQGASEVLQRLSQVNAAGKYEFHQCDVSLLANIKKLSQKLKQQLPSINYLILSSGMLSMAGRTETSEGNDVKMAVHLYSRMLFARELAPNVAKAAASGQQARIMSVLDAARSNINKIDFDDLALKHNFGLVACATHCITMTDVALQDILAKHPAISAMHAHPGLVYTSLARNIWWLPKFLIYPFATTADDSADYLFSAFAKPAHQPGFFSVERDGELISGVPRATPDQARKVMQHLEVTMAV